MNFRTFIETIVCGQCFQWACKQAMLNKSITVYHGIVSQPFSEKPPYNHAWIENNGLIQDWQTMEAHHGGKYMGKGYPKEIFYELFSPQNVKKYTAQEVVEKRSKSGHCGPWE